jgi:hypothetical protein
VGTLLEALLVAVSGDSQQNPPQLKLLKLKLRRLQGKSEFVGTLLLAALLTAVKGDSQQEPPPAEAEAPFQE